MVFILLFHLLIFSSPWFLITRTFNDEAFFYCVAGEEKPTEQHFIMTGREQICYGTMKLY